MIRNPALREYGKRQQFKSLRRLRTFKLRQDGPYRHTENPVCDLEVEDTDHRTKKRRERLKVCVEPGINCNASRSVTIHAYRPAFAELIVSLDDFALGLGYVG